MLSALAVLLMPCTADAQVCPPSTAVYADDFSDSATEGTGSTVDGWGTGTIGPPELSSTLTGVAGTLGLRVYAAVSIGDIDGANGDDLVVLTDMPDCHLHFLRNLGTTAGSHDGWDGDDDATAGIADFTSTGFDNHRISPALASCSTQGAILMSGLITSSDPVNVDFLYFSNTDIEARGQFSQAIFYSNNGAVSGFPTWTQYTLNQIDEEPGAFPLSSRDWSWHHTSATSGYLVDWDSDGQVDIVLGSSQDNAGVSGTKTYDEVWVKLANLTDDADVYTDDANPVLGSMGLTRPIAGDNVAAQPCITDSGAVSRGITLLLAEDFDKDGDIDIVGGSMSELGLMYFENNGTSFPSPSSGTPNPMYNSVETLTINANGVNVGGIAYGVAVDLNSDGYMDFVVARDEEGCDSNSAFSAEPGGGLAWGFVYNTSGPPTFLQQPIPLANRGHDVDWIAKADVDNDGSMDVLVGSR